MAALLVPEDQHKSESLRQLFGSAACWLPVIRPVWRLAVALGLAFAFEIVSGALKIRLALVPDYTPAAFHDEANMDVLIVSHVMQQRSDFGKIGVLRLNRVADKHAIIAD